MYAGFLLYTRLHQSGPLAPITFGRKNGRVLTAARQTLHGPAHRQRVRDICRVLVSGPHSLHPAYRDAGCLCYLLSACCGGPCASPVLSTPPPTRPVLTSRVLYDCRYNAMIWNSCAGASWMRGCLWQNRPPPTFISTPRRLCTCGLIRDFGFTIKFFVVG